LPDLEGGRRCVLFDAPSPCSNRVADRVVGHVVVAEVPPIHIGGVAGVAPAVAVAIVIAMGVSMGGVTPTVRWARVPADVASGADPDHVGCTI
jgi:hypothetical protein